MMIVYILCDYSLLSLPCSFLSFFSSLCPPSFSLPPFLALSVSLFSLSLSCKADVRIDDRCGNTALHYAVSSNNPELVEFLLRDKDLVQLINKRNQVTIILVVIVHSTPTSFSSYSLPPLFPSLLPPFLLLSLSSLPPLFPSLLLFLSFIILHYTELLYSSVWRSLGSSLPTRQSLPSETR